MNIEQISYIAAAALMIGCGGLARGTDNSLYVGMVGFLVCISFVIQALRMLQKQLDELKSSSQETTEEGAN